MKSTMIERLGSVSMSAGVVRIQCMATGADGKEKEAVELLIPAASFGQVAGGLQEAGRQLQAKIEQARKDESGQAEQ